MSRSERNKKYIDSDVQGALSRRLIWHWCVFLIVAGVTAYLLQVLSNPFRPQMDHLKDLWWTHGPFLLVLVFLLPVFVVDTVKLSHRFAGPVFNLRRAMRKVADGEPPQKLQFRDNDFWHGLSDEYNAMLTKLAPEVEQRKPIEDEKELVGSTK
jgi:hypothetical protein